MEVRNNCSPAFNGIFIKSSVMNDAQQVLSRRISDMLDYTDEYVKLADDVDVYILPGKSKKSIVVKFMDACSEMLFKNGKKDVKTTIHADNSNYSKSVDEIRQNLKGIDAGEFTAPEFDAMRFIEGTTDLAKLDPGVYDEIAEDAAKLESKIGKEAAELNAVDSYQRLKKLDKAAEF